MDSTSTKLLTNHSHLFVRLVMIDPRSLRPLHSRYRNSDDESPSLYVLLEANRRLFDTASKGMKRVDINCSISYSIDSDHQQTTSSVQWKNFRTQGAGAGLILGGGGGGTGNGAKRRATAGNNLFDYLSPLAQTGFTFKQHYAHPFVDFELRLPIKLTFLEEHKKNTSLTLRVNQFTLCLSSVDDWWHSCANITRRSHYYHTSAKVINPLPVLHPVTFTLSRRIRSKWARKQAKNRSRSEFLLPDRIALCMAPIFGDVALLKYWLDYHLLEGVIAPALIDEFHLYVDEESLSDRTRQVLKKAKQDAPDRLRLWKWGATVRLRNADSTAADINYGRFNFPHGQYAAYADCRQRNMMRVRYLFYLDSDDFLSLDGRNMIRHLATAQLIRRQLMDRWQSSREACEWRMPWHEVDACCLFENGAALAGNWSALRSNWTLRTMTKHAEVPLRVMQTGVHLTLEPGKPHCNASAGTAVDLHAVHLKPLCLDSSGMEEDRCRSHFDAYQRYFPGPETVHLNDYVTL